MRDRSLSLWSVVVGAVAFILGAPLAGSAAIIVSSLSASVWVEFNGITVVNVNDGSREAVHYTSSKSASSFGSLSVNVTAGPEGAFLDGDPLLIPPSNYSQLAQASQTSLVTDGQISFSGSVEAISVYPFSQPGTSYQPDAYSMFDLRFQLTEDTDFVFRLTDFTSYYGSEGVGGDEIKLIRDVPYPGPDDVLFRAIVFQDGVDVALSTPPCVGGNDECTGGQLIGTPWPLHLTAGDYRFHADLSVNPPYSPGATSLGVDMQAVPVPGTGLLVITGLLGLAGWRRRRV